MTNLASISLSSLCTCLVAVLLVMLPASTSYAADTRMELSGRWQFMPVEMAALDPAKPDIPSDHDQRWSDIQVPDNWFRQGHDIHGYAWYRTQFDLAPAWAGKQIRLVFGGVDYEADVWLNGHYLGHHVGYFQTFDFDVSDYMLKRGNQLTVLVNSPLEKAEDWSLHKRILKGIFSHHDTRPGGAWSVRGQEQNTGGIWAPVWLQSSNGLALGGLKLQPNKQENGAWRLHVEAPLTSRLADSARAASFQTDSSEVGNVEKVEMVATVVPENFAGPSQVFRQTRSIKQGDSLLSADFELSQPQLWWPTGHGKPNLYRLKLEMLHKRRVLDRREGVFGVREITIDGASQQWLVNGRRLFVRGTNYISTQWLAEMTPKAYARDIALMKQANINAIRVHAHIEAPAFYEACDRNGMLILQDYMLQWGYRDDEAFIAEARRQAADMVNALGNHPSIAVWSLHNEPPWDSPWMQFKYPGYNPQQNRALDDVLYADIAKLDTMRSVKKVSPTIEHAWIGWYFGRWQDFAAPAPAPWITEFGAQALPNLTSLQKIFKPQHIWPDSEEKWQLWEFHNFQRHETFELAKVQQGDNIQAFIDNTQAYQAKLIQFAVESYRRQRYAPVTAMFQFMFNEDWPSINWGVVDYWRQPKAAYQALKTAYQPVLPSIEWTQETYHAGETATLGLWAINDTWQAFTAARYEVRVLRDGKTFAAAFQAVDSHASPLSDTAFSLNIAADSGRKLQQLSIAQLLPGRYEVKARLLSAQGHLLGQNTHRFTVLP